MIIMIILIPLWYYNVIMMIRVSFGIYKGVPFVAEASGLQHFRPDLRSGCHVGQKLLPCFTGPKSTLAKPRNQWFLWAKRKKWEHGRVSSRSGFEHPLQCGFVHAWNHMMGFSQNLVFSYSAKSKCGSELWLIKQWQYTCLLVARTKKWEANGWRMSNWEGAMCLNILNTTRALHRYNTL